MFAATMRVSILWGLEPNFRAEYTAIAMKTIIIKTNKISSKRTLNSQASVYLYFVLKVFERILSSGDKMLAFRGVFQKQKVALNMFLNLIIIILSNVKVG